MNYFYTNIYNHHHLLRKQLLLKSKTINTLCQNNLPTNLTLIKIQIIDMKHL